MGSQQAMLPSQACKAAGSPAESVESSDSSSTEDTFLTAQQSPEGSVSHAMITRKHSSGSSDSYFSAEEKSRRVTGLATNFNTTDKSEKGAANIIRDSSPTESSKRQPGDNWDKSRDQKSSEDSWSLLDMDSSQVVVSGLKQSLKKKAPLVGCSIIKFKEYQLDRISWIL